MVGMGLAVRISEYCWYQLKINVGSAGSYVAGC